MSIIYKKNMDKMYQFPIFNTINPDWFIS